MKAGVKIPHPYNPESLILSMQTLKLDPNFGALCAMVKENDIATMQSVLIKGKNQETNEKMTQEETDELRYRLEVFEEFLGMPDTIIEAMAAERTWNKEEETREDAYFTEADIEKSRG